MGKYGKLFYLKNKMGTLISEINKLLIAKGKNEIFYIQRWQTGMD